jgi:hypothetical protein
VLVALGAGLLVADGLNARGVELSWGMEASASGVEVGEAGGKSAGEGARVEVGSSGCPASTVSPMTVGR